MRHIVRWMSWIVVLSALAAQSFAQCTLSTLPGNGETNVPTTPTLKWTNVGATQYDIYLGPAGSNACSANSPAGSAFGGATQFNPPPLQPGTTYEWKVRAVNGACANTQSACSTFTTASAASCPSSAPLLASPANNATVPFGNVTLSWSSVPNATSYEVFVGLPGSTPVSKGITNTTTRTLDMEPGRTVEWYVVARGGNACNPMQSATRTFTSSCPTSGAVLQIPPDQASHPVDHPITFAWFPVAGAASYDLRISIDNFQTFTILAENLEAINFSTSFHNAGVYQWEVRANFDGACIPLYSTRRQLTIGSSCPIAPPTLLTPAQGSSGNNSPVTFSWSPIAGATEYRIFAAVGDDDFAFYGSTTATSVERVVAPGRAVKWFVVARFATCPEVRSATGTFSTIGAVNCLVQRILLNTPANNESVNSPVKLTWSALTGVQFYRVWISIDGGPPVNIARTTSAEATVNLPAGTMSWYVEGDRGSCEPVVSDERRFVVARAATCGANVAPTLVAPNGNTLTNATLQWSAVPNAIAYRVWMSDDGVAFEDIRLTRDTSLQIELEPGRHVWFVQAFFEGCEPLASARGSFTVTESTPRCPSAAPSIVAPAQGTTVASPVTFQWTAVAGAQKYRVFAQPENGTTILIGVTDATQLTHEMPPGVFDWAVEAVFEECPSTVSPRVRFTVPRAQNCSTAKAQPIAPGDNATEVASPVNFAWSAVSGAAGYLLVAKVNDGAPTAIERTTATSASIALPPGARIEWWVLTFFGGCEPTESAHLRFNVARPQNCDNRKPILLLPGDRGGDAPSPVHFQWTNVPNATGYKVWLRQGTNDASVIAVTTEPRAIVELPVGAHEWFVEADFASCEPTRSALGEFKVAAPVACGTPRRPLAQVIGQALSGTEYRLRWTPLANVQLYEVQESTTLDFANAKTFTTDDTVLPFVHEVATGATQYLYRVRGVSSCNDARGPFSESIGVFVIAPRANNASAEIGFEGNVVQKVFLPGGPAPQQFLATADKPWLKVTPSAGTLPVEGLTLTVTADPRVLSLGTNTGTIKVTYSSAAKGQPATNAGTTTTIPLSVSLVTPVLPAGKGTPPPDSLIFPVVGHAQGANDSLFESDIRVTNLAATTQKYQLNFTPSGVNGTTTGSSSTVEIAPNATMALDDIVASLFGTGTTSSATGMLEVRPLTTASSSATTGFFGSTSTASTVKQLLTAASSRTYNFTPTGTFGQFIPATRFADFVGRAVSGTAPSILSLQQVAQSTAFRANFGFAEASGKPADLAVRVYDTHNTLLKTIPLSLQAGEHKQINGMLAANGIDNLTDGRVEVEVIGGDGKVTAYVSEVDNLTNDPLLVSAVVKGATSASRYVLPGVAYIQNDSAFWVSDVRIFNAGTTATAATLTFYPQGNPSAAVTRDVTIDAGEIEVIDNILGDLFAQPNGAGGSIVVTTPASSKLTASARTYNKTAKGTYGQYIPGVTTTEAVGNGDRALQVLQLEQSSRLRTNIGLAETTGQSARVEVSVIVPDQIATPVVTIDLQPNEFRQLTLGAGGFGLDSVYNARVTVKVIGGSGRVTAYGSAIDLITQDPTYVPAQ